MLAAIFPCVYRTCTCTLCKYLAFTETVTVTVYLRLSANETALLHVKLSCVLQGCVLLKWTKLLASHFFAVSGFLLTVSLERVWWHTRTLCRPIVHSSCEWLIEFLFYASDSGQALWTFSLHLYMALAETTRWDWNTESGATSLLTSYVCWSREIIFFLIFIKKYIDTQFLASFKFYSILFKRSMLRVSVMWL